MLDNVISGMLSSLVLSFFVSVPIGLVCYIIANQKGRRAIWWFLYGFMFPIVALAHVIVIKNSGAYKCMYCRGWIDYDAVVCKHCGRETYDGRSYG